MALRISASGVGLSLPTNRFTPWSFASAVLRLIDPVEGFEARVMKLRLLLLSDPAGLGRQKGANLIEDLLQRGYAHLVPLETEQPGWARAGLDITVLDFALIASGLWILGKIVSIAWKRIRMLVVWKRGDQGKAAKDS